MIRFIVRKLEEHVFEEVMTYEKVRRKEVTSGRIIWIINEKND